MGKYIAVGIIDRISAVQIKNDKSFFILKFPFTYIKRYTF